MLGYAINVQMGFNHWDPHRSRESSYPFPCTLASHYNVWKILKLLSKYTGLFLNLSLTVMKGYCASHVCYRMFPQVVSVSRFLGCIKEFGVEMYKRRPKYSTVSGRVFVCVVGSEM